MPMNPRLLRPLARFQALPPPFSPADVSGLSLWLDASDISTLKQNSDGTGSVANGDPVGYWQDKSGDGNHAVQSGSSSLKPSYASNNTNALGAVLFDNSALNRLEFSPNPLAGSSAGSLFFVCRGDQGEGACIGSPVANLGADSSADHYPCGGTTIYNSFGSTARYSFSAVADFTATHATAIVASGSGWNCWQNGGLAYSLASNAVAWSSSGAAIGGRSSEGMAAFFFPGVVCEVLLYSEAVSESSRNAITSYLMTKWGIA